MKKILLLLAVVGITTLSGCDGDEGPQGPAGPEAEVFELLNVNFGFSNGGYSIYRTLTPNIYDSDNILIYRLSGLIDSQTPIWQLIPRTIYFEGSSDELDYDYDFSKEDFTIYAGGNFDISTEPNYLNNQTFRIVIIPGYFSNKGKTVDVNDYNAVVQAYHIKESHIKTLQ
jgi:hypothetical protein